MEDQIYVVVKLVRTPEKRQCSWYEPTELANELIQAWGQEGFIWLDGDGSNLGRWAILAIDPIEEICCRGIPNNTNNHDPFEKLNKLPQGHWTGWLSYEAGAWIEPTNPWREDDMATLWIAHHDPIFKFDLAKKELWLEGCDINRLNKIENWIRKIKRRQYYSNRNKQRQLKTNNLKGIPINSWIWSTNQDQYKAKVNHIRELIKKGDIFQANLTTCCINSLKSEQEILDIFLKLRQNCPAPFSGLVIGSNSAHGEAIISTSPERFLKVLHNGEVESRPIKGTRPRKKTFWEDAEMAAELVCSSKDRAENIMIVDLLRNDLGKVCIPGSIVVTQLLGLESYAKVHHLTSVIRGKLKTNKTWVDLLKASWPGGSITGAPKLRACQRLFELEPTSRGPYCGSMLHINWDGTFDSNILIRSLLIKDLKLKANAGCGIVADSNADEEAQELTWKLMPLLKALE